MKIHEIRIYSEVLEQGIDFKEYIKKIDSNLVVKNIYTKKLRGEFNATDSIIDRIRKVKDIDVLLTVISGEKEYPLLLVEYSTAVPTDDHKMQRADVYYWSSIFKTPMMKISPTSKGMDQKFGGGSKFSDELEISVACKRKSILYHIPWENEEERDCLSVKKNALSCISYSEKIYSTLNNIVNKFSSVATFDDYFDILQNDFSNDNKKSVENYTDTKIKESITESIRFNWFGNKLRVKINRFGHAMDPERGVLFFVNMLLGAKNTISEIQVNRPADYNCRGGYAKLFDALGREQILENYVKNIIKKGNVFTDDDAIYVFKTALSIDDSLPFKKVSAHNYNIADEDLLHFLNTHPSISTKSIFFLSTELQLTDKDRNLICSIKWSDVPIKQFINNISTTNFNITKISDLSIRDAKEDIITYAGVELFKKLKYDLLAVSYPGAQGDRCVLTGSGRDVIRTYIDIIAYKSDSDGIKVHLQECKEKFSASKSDERKLCAFKTNRDKKDGLNQLFKKTVGVTSFSKLYTSLAAKATTTMPNFDVDYIFMFDIEDTDSTTKINYSVAIIDVALVKDFAELKNRDGKLKGTIEIEKIYRIS